MYLESMLGNLGLWHDVFQLYLQSGLFHYGEEGKPEKDGTMGQWHLLKVEHRSVSTCTP